MVNKMSKIKLAVIFGGKSSEYSVSLHSASSAIRNMDREKYDLTFVGITKDGKWYYCPDNVDAIEHDHWQQLPGVCEVVLSCSQAQQGFLKLYDDGTYDVLKVDCIFPILHGKNGEDGTIQGLFALAGIPFVGCDHLSSAISMDKDYTHIICEAAGIPMAPYLCVINTKDLDYQKVYEQVEEKLSFPVFIKPANAGSSYGISKIRNYEEFERGLKLAFEHDRKVILETGIEGFEVGTAVMGNEDIFVGAVDEIETHKDFFDFAAKYDLDATTIHCPARISTEKRDEIRAMAKTIYHALGCQGLTRVDLFLTPDGNIYFNEVNTIPGFTSASRYPSMMKEAGISFPELIDRLVSLAMERTR